MDIHTSPMLHTADRSASRAGTPSPGGGSLPVQAVSVERTPPDVPSANAKGGGDRGGFDPSDARSLDAAVEQINDFVQVIQRDLEFSIDDDTGRTIVKVLDRHTQELIRQVPPEEFLAMVAHLEEVKEGLLVKEQA
ncbi:flagellar protein FlaG [Ectothiorhodospira lacustris]|uniref:flagellar protein FlaG n=1 Tax=Ectothiorhodospira lacustris TaxID=2899127 RepID=UPI001EE7EFAA|nr:flagellar protein FlaG [Ectothiorhodospira lacustris]MCG5501472.1 flagellar protein FlaG [Ectothiorhodospira lacustris]